MQIVNIRPININDIEQLLHVSKQTFIDTFSEENKSEDVTRYIDESFSMERLTLEFNQKGSKFYFAEIDNNVIGYLKLNSGKSQTELRDEDGIEIERIYVVKAFLGKKVGQQLFEHAINMAKARNARYIWLGVWEKNFRAISFYKKNGFEEFDKHLFKLGSDIQTDIMIKLELNH